jgi:hypothetical protein
MKANSINQVLEFLDIIINESKILNSRIGYFASLYKKMTLAVQKGIMNNEFEDGLRMEQLDVVFANRYLEAYQNYTNQIPTTKSWNYVFEKSNDRLTIIQHLLLGINTHINLDLGIAAAEISDISTISHLQNDFDKINFIIASLLSEVQNDLGEVCYPMRFLERINMEQIDSVINFSVKVARKTAWANALALVAIVNKENYVNGIDETILKVANTISNPNFSKSILVKTIQFFESKNIEKNIQFLNS